MIYMDNAATTKIKKEVLDEMMPYLTENYGNPSSLYKIGYESKNAILNAKSIIAKTINSNIKDIYFTSGGSESDNWAIRGVLELCKNKGKHIITSKIEHHAILNTCKYLEKHGYEVTYLDVDENGIIRLNELKKAIRPDTILISIMFANNEIGTIQPIKEIGKLAKKHKIIFHTDAVQSYGHIDIDVRKLNINLMSVSGHKIHASKGVGFLYSNIPLEPLIFGGKQQDCKRAGTENVASIVGLGKACEIVCTDIENRENKIKNLRNYMWDKLKDIFKNNIILNGSYDKRLANNINVCFNSKLTGETLQILLGDEDIYVSTGSACMSGDLEPSHVLKAIKVSDDIINNSLRFTLSEDNTTEEIDIVIDTLKKCVQL